MVRKTLEGKIEQYDKAMPESYWLRNKKQVVDLKHGTPFAIDRQLEDQRFTMERNRNPQFYNTTKVDKVRSELIIAKKGASRAVAVKANVLNKIVREASGIHNYTIVAPPRGASSLQEQTTEILDPETNPRVKSYATEAKQKPVLCSFGHRPSSASRTFHPATMKFRLKHGEIAADTNKTGFGLPVAVLKQILYAPKISMPGAAASNDEDADGTGLVDQHDLFFSQDEQSQLFSTAGGVGRKSSAAAKSMLRHRGSSGAFDEEFSMSKASWVSGNTQLQRRNDTQKLAPV